jgi:uncharacterized damage-inducible protein DinB
LTAVRFPAYLDSMIRKISDFVDAWQAEAASTLKILRALSDDSLRQKVTPDGRSLGFLAWHLTTTLGEMMGHAGVPLSAVTEKDTMPASAAAIADAYESGAKAVAEAVQASWTDAQLTDDIPMYGETWKKSFVLAALITHQIHHRGQMTVLMRQAGLKVPGVYGPAKEEWAAYGMPAQP